MPGDEYLEIDGVALDTPAWIVTDLGPLWEPADVRGGDRLIPGAAGVRSYQRRATVTRKALAMSIFGDVDQAGTPQADVRAGLWANVAYLRANVVDAGPMFVTTLATSTAIGAVGGSFRPSDVGKSIVGAGIPAGATIAAVASAVTATLSTAATATGTSAVTLGGPGTRTAVLHAPGAVTRSGAVHVLGLKLEDHGAYTLRGVLELSIPAGALL